MTCPTCNRNDLNRKDFYIRDIDRVGKECKRCMQKKSKKKYQDKKKGNWLVKACMPI